MRNCQHLSLLPVPLVPHLLPTGLPLVSHLSSTCLPFVSLLLPLSCVLLVSHFFSAHRPLFSFCLPLVPHFASTCPTFLHLSPAPTLLSHPSTSLPLVSACLPLVPHSSPTCLPVVVSHLSPPEKLSPLVSHLFLTLVSQMEASLRCTLFTKEFSTRICSS